ncbi:Reverse transcriptase zinc-binding domain [Arabidopsis thaliana x Arabidopsis arenosa]|uniref:Reverse transcriptase zinc-binding domain n=1 Tax=Arabidopsis thaliana x Arabidopsis arenosa TaxID=1240361 RepID=A0A8T2C7W5_9BRAS|nr:Reverse transcriptase zinc-binding domain [Arabidopsis thaliana x Arabidopsis arenosa]
MVIKGVPGLVDRVSWSRTENGAFSVRSAYPLLCDDGIEGPCMARFFDRIWRIMAPERVRLFLWLVGHQVILTNMERVRRRMGESEICQVCRGANESIIHVLRDCPAMAGIWLRLIPRTETGEFFGNTLLEWLFTNLLAKADPSREHWVTLFAMASWWGWKWRCKDVFGEHGLWRDRIGFIRKVAAEVVSAHVAERGSDQSISRGVEQISWHKPALGWVKVNTDGASHGNPGQATAGGVVRDTERGWLSGFVLNIGVCSAMLAELWGVYYGLYVAWEKGYRRVVLESDSALVVGYLQSGIEETHPLAFLVRMCHGFISRDWIVRVTFVYREANRLADGLANYAFTLPLGFHLCNVCPDVVLPVLLDDTNGTAFPRNVRL